MGTFLIFSTEKGTPRGKLKAIEAVPRSKRKPLKTVTN
jgi:hypothetical protein